MPRSPLWRHNKIFKKVMQIFHLTIVHGDLHCQHVVSEELLSFWETERQIWLLFHYITHNLLISIFFLSLRYDLWLPKLSNLSNPNPNVKGQLMAFERYHPHKGKNVLWGHLDLWPPTSKEVILEFKWIFAPNLRKFPEGILEILRSQER